MDEVEKKNFYDESVLMVERFINKFCDTIQSQIKVKKLTSESQGYYFMRPTFKELWIDDQFKIHLNEKYKKKADRKEKEALEDSMNVGGFIDSVQKDFEGNIILVDYKTSNKYKNVLSDEYVLQLGIYAYLWQKQFGKLPYMVCINYLKFDESYYILVTPSLIADAKAKILSMRNQIVDFKLDEEKYYKKESKLCDWCGHKEHCLKAKDVKVIEVEDETN